MTLFVLTAAVVAWLRRRRTIQQPSLGYIALTEERRRMLERQQHQQKLEEFR